MYFRINRKPVYIEAVDVVIKVLFETETQKSKAASEVCVNQNLSLQMEGLWQKPKNLSLQMRYMWTKISPCKWEVCDRDRI